MARTYNGKRCSRGHGEEHQRLYKRRGPGGRLRSSWRCNICCSEAAKKRRNTPEGKKKQWDSKRRARARSRLVRAGVIPNALPPENTCECGRYKEAHVVCCKMCCSRDQLFGGRDDNSGTPLVVYPDLIGFSGETVEEIASRLGRSVDSVYHSLVKLVERKMVTRYKYLSDWDIKEIDAIPWRYTLARTGDMVTKEHGKSSTVQSQSHA